MRIVAVILCILLAVGCSEKDNVPSDVIGKEEMEKILWDMMMADQYSANYLIKDSAKVNVKMETLKLYEEVFRLHKVSRDEFRKSFQFYQDRPDMIRVMFDSLLAKGNRARIENYTHPQSTPVPAAPVVAPGGINPASVHKPGGNMPGKPAGVLPNRPAVKAPLRPFPAKDSVKNHGRPPGSFPGRPAQLMPGAHPFLGRESGNPLRAGGQIPFKPMRKGDTLMRSRQ